MTLRLEQDDEEAERKARMAIERRTELELRRALNDMMLTLFPEGWDTDFPAGEAERIHRAFLEEQKLRDAVSRALQDSADLGVSVTVKQLESVGYGFDWTMANVHARDWALAHTDNLLNQMGTTSGRFVGQAVGRWFENGEPLEKLISDIGPMFNANRARTIAVTEVTRATTQGNIQTMRDSGTVTRIEWMTNADEFVCKICAPLDGRTVAVIQEAFFDQLPSEQREALSRRAGSRFDYPPAHVNCRCRVAPVVDEPKREVKPKPPKPPAPKPVTVPSPVVDDIVERRRRAEEIATAARVEADRLAAEERARLAAASSAPRAAIPYSPSQATLDTVNAKIDKTIAEAALRAGITPAEFETAADKGFKKLTKDYDLAIQFQSKNMNKFLKDPRFKTQFETNTSGGANDKVMRSDAEEKGMGVPRDINPKERPIYGYLNLGERAQGNVSQYGDITFILKNEVRQRTTVTMDDSLANFSYQRVAGMPISEARRESWDAAINALREYGQTNDVNKVLDRVSYVEIQAHGGVKISDIRGIIDRNNSLNASQRKQLQAQGIEIWDK